MKTAILLFLSFFFAAILLSAADDASKPPDKPVDLAHDKNLYVIGYAHLDTQWRWTYPYVIQNFIRDTMEQNFPLIEKYPHYVFNFTGSRRYEFMKEYYPEDYAKVKKYVAAGRWFPAGSSVDENDANIPSLESMTRHFLYGNHFFQREFGVQSDEYMLPDCFGFPASLPTVLAHGGIKGFSTQKLTWRSAVGIPFNVGTWVGPDGSSVVAALNPGGYGGDVTEDLSQSEMWLNRIKDNGQKSGVYADYHYYGTGDCGGAPESASVQWIEQSATGSGPVRVISSRSDQMFKDITPDEASKLPTYKGELLLINHSAGSITSEAYMKRWNRKNEQLANAAESAATAAFWLKGMPYPGDMLYRAWDLALGSQMHDIMPGTSLPKAYEYAWNDEILALNQFASVTERATASVVAQLDTRAKGFPVAVYNPLSIDREDPVEASIPCGATTPKAITAFDSQGKAVPTQILGREGDFLRVLFIAKVPSDGYAIYDLRPETNPAASTLTVTDHSLQNARYRVSLNADGDIASIFDKVHHHELLSSPTQLSFHTENPSMFPAWNMDWSDRQKPARGYVKGPAKIRIVENGPARVALEVERTAENGVFNQRIRLAAGSSGDRVEILDRIDWRSFSASLKADFHFADANFEATYDDKVGVVQRGDNNERHFEVPMQQWMDLTGHNGTYGVEVMSDSKYGSDKPDDNTLRLTLIYSPGTRSGYRDQGTQDHGRHEILYALAGHSGNWIEGNDVWQSARLNQPLRSFRTDSHPGPLGNTFSLLSLNKSQVQVAAVKKAEDSDEIIVRLKELTGQPVTGIALSFPAAVTSAREVDAQERQIGSASVQNGQLIFDMKPFSLRAFALKLAPPTSPPPPVASEPVPLNYDTDVVSSRSQRSDGAMDANGDTYPAELFPKQLAFGGVDFQLGPVTDGQKNALTANGQQISLPAGNFTRVHLLAAADGDTTAEIKLGDIKQSFNVPNWTGYIGQWDNRIWDTPIPELDYDPSQKMVGLTPGYIKRASVAWFATHHNAPQGDAFYAYSYLFQLSYDLPLGTTSITLPDNSKIRVFAVSVSQEPPATPAAAPLYDTLADHQPGDAPIIPQAGQTFHEATEIALVPPLYHQPGDLHYTLDGTDPTVASPVYTDPFIAEADVKIAVAQIYAGGHAGPIVRGTIKIQDTTLPTITKVWVEKQENALSITFSKPVNAASATAAKNYAIEPAIPIQKIEASANGQSVKLLLGGPINPGTDYIIAVSGVEDIAQSRNTLARVTEPFNAGNIVYTLPRGRMPTQGVQLPVTSLPLEKNDAWTINLLVNPETKPEDRIVIAGFGSDGPDRESGTGRYLAVFEDGIRFWASNRDVPTNSPLEIGRWQMLTASYDGNTISIYKDGNLIKKDDVDLTSDSQAHVSIGMSDPWKHRHTLHGSIQAFTIRRGAMSSDEVRQLFESTKPAP